MSDFLGLMERRFACRHFLPGRDIGESTADFIVECGRLSPSSFGLEPWEFVRFHPGGNLARLGGACFSQPPVLEAALAVAILVRREKDYDPEGEYVRQRAMRFPGGPDAFLPDYRGYFGFLKSQGRVLEWSRAQAYIAAANMMTGAMSVGVDSCAIEGFDEAAVLECSGAPPDERAVGLVVAFGYAADPPAPKIRMPVSAISRRA